MNWRKLLTLLLLLISFAQTNAQNKEVKYIYLFDCTTSMKGYGGAPDIWQKAKDCLRGDIEKKTDQCDILFIPFQDSNPLSTNTFRRDQFRWDDLESRIDGVVDKPTNTDIVGAWNRAMKAVNPHGQNVIYLLTDGSDNVHGTHAVADLIRNWCPTAPDNVQVVYFMLTPASENPEIEQAINECDEHIRLVKGINDNIITMNGIVWRFDTGSDTVRAELFFTYRHTFEAQAQENSPYYDVVIDGGSVNQGVARLMAIKRVPDEQLEQLPEKLDFEVTIVPKDARRVNIINPTFPAEVTNRPINSLQLLAGDNNLNLGDADYYPSFLFFRESEPATVVCDLKAVFNRHALKNNGAIQYKVTSDKGNDDFDVIYNGQPCPDCSFIIQAKEKEATLTLQFHRDANTEKRHFLLSPIAATNLEMVNGLPAPDYRMDLAADYDINWNPWARALLVIGIILVAAALLWFLVLKRFFFPTFRGVSQLKVTEPVFAVKKLKGVRRVVIANKLPQKKQSALGKLFKGKIVYFINPSFLQSIITAEPDGRAVRLQTAQNVLCIPLNKLPRGAETELEETDTNLKMKIQAL